MSNVLGALFSDIANAIRLKTGDTEKMKPSEFPSAIKSISTGSGNGIDTSELTEVYPVTELTAVTEFNHMSPIMYPLGLSAGDIYLVDWNGVGYIREAKKLEPLVAVIGNTAVIGGEDTGEPFAIAEIPKELIDQTGGANVLVAPLDGSTTFKVGVYRIGKNFSETILEDIPITLDFSAGNQNLTVPDGYFVKSAIIEKPATLVPENILSGIDIAGIIGTAVEGSGSGSVVVGNKILASVKTFDFKYYLENGRVKRYPICLPEDNDPVFILIWKILKPGSTSSDVYDMKFSYAYAFNTKQYEVEKHPYSIRFPTRRVAYADYSFGLHFTSETYTGMHDPIDSTIEDEEDRIMHSGDIIFYRDESGRGYIDVGVPTNSGLSRTWSWDENSNHELLCFSIQDK